MQLFVSPPWGGLAPFHCVTDPSLRQLTRTEVTGLGSEIRGQNPWVLHLERGAIRCLLKSGQRTNKNWVTLSGVLGEARGADTLCTGTPAS